MSAKRRSKRSALQELIGEVTVGKMLGGVVLLGAALTYLLGGWSWAANKVVWSRDDDEVVWESRLQQVAGGIDCQFAELNRNTLEGQAADTQFKINTLTAKKGLAAEEARELAALNVRLGTINRRLGALAECKPGVSVQQPVTRPTGPARSTR